MILEQLEPRILLSAVGDMNNDGVVNGADAQIISEYVVHLHGWPLAPDVVAQGDLSGDGRLSGFDASIASSLAPYDGHTLTINGILNVWAPNPTDFGSMWFPTASLWGPDGIPNIEAIHQGVLADCYLLGAVGGIAIEHPSMLLPLVTQSGSDVAVTWQTTQGVKLVVHTYYGLSRQYQINNGLDTYWLYFEKTYAYFRTALNQTWWIPQVNTMASTEWGDPSTVLIQLQDTPIQQPNYSGQSNQKILQMLSGALVAHEPVVFLTTASAPTMIESHVYVITAVDLVAQTVTCYNPWGFYDTRTISDLLLNDNNLNSFYFGA